MLALNLKIRVSHWDIDRGQEISKEPMKGRQNAVMEKGEGNLWKRRITWGGEWG